MPEIDFLSDNQNKDELPSPPRKDEAVRWTEPPVAAQPGKRGWLSSFFKKTVPASPTAQAEAPRPASRQEVLKMIRSYVDEKEAGAGPVPRTQEKQLDAASIAPPTVVDLSPVADDLPLAAERPRAGDFSQIRPPAVPAVTGKKTGWLKFLFSRRQPKKARELAVLATDLIKGEIITFFDWKKNIIILIFFILLSGLILAGSYQALDVWEKSRQQQIRDFTEKFRTLSVDIRQAEKDTRRILFLQKKLEAVKTLLAEHVYWTNFFKFLEEDTLADVYYSGFSGDTKGNYVMPATTKNFDMIAQQIKTFEADEAVRRAVTSGGQKVKSRDRAGSVSFDIQLSVDPNLFFKK